MGFCRAECRHGKWDNIDSTVWQYSNPGGLAVDSGSAAFFRLLGRAVPAVLQMCPKGSGLTENWLRYGDIGIHGRLSTLDKAQSCSLYIKTNHHFFALGMCLAGEHVTGLHFVGFEAVAKFHVDFAF